MRQFLLLGVFFCSLVLLACTSAKSEAKDLQIVPLENAEVERVYGLYQQGDYAAYVAEMASCESAPESYRKQMTDLHKQHAMLQQEKMGSVASASVVKLTPSADGRQANVILRVNYRNQTHEEILLSFVWVKDRWRLR